MAMMVNGEPVRMYRESRDLWVGCYVGDEHVYLCPIPTVVVRWRRSDTAIQVAKMTAVLRPAYGKRAGAVARDWVAQGYRAIEFLPGGFPQSDQAGTLVIPHEIAEAPGGAAEFLTALSEAVLQVRADTPIPRIVSESQWHAEGGRL